MPYPVADASIVPVVVACAVGAARFRRLEPALRYLVGLVFFELLVEIVSRVLADQHRPNLFVLPIDTLVEFGLLALVYYRASWPTAKGRGLLALIAIFSLVSLFSYTDPASLVRFNSLQRFVESFLVLGLVLLYFYKVIRELVIVHLEKEPMFWVSVGLLLYFSGNVFIFISSNYVIQHSRDLSMKLWDVHAILYMVLNGLYAGALWISPSSKK